MSDAASGLVLAEDPAGPGAPGVGSAVCCAPDGLGAQQLLAELRRALRVKREAVLSLTGGEPEVGAALELLKAWRRGACAPHPPRPRPHAPR